MKENYCWNIGKSVVLKYLEEPEELGMTCGPGPFSMANEEVTRAMLKSAGFTDINVFHRAESPRYK